MEKTTRAALPSALTDFLKTYQVQGINGWGNLIRLPLHKHLSDVLTANEVDRFVNALAEFMHTYISDAADDQPTEEPQ